MKTCFGCMETEPSVEFGKNKSRRDGKQGYCIECMKDARNKYNKTPKGKEASRRKRRKYAESSRGRESAKKSDNKVRRVYSDRISARKAVQYAIKKGDLTRPTICERCGDFHEADGLDKIQGHHHSYEKEYWLDVEWLCDPCHDKIHNGGTE